MRGHFVACLERSYKLLMDEVNRTHEPHASLKMKTISKVSIILLQLRCMHIGAGCCWDNLGLDFEAAVDVRVRGTCLS